jgi:hypothetical protein
MESPFTVVIRLRAIAEPQNPTFKRNVQ